MKRGCKMGSHPGTAITRAGSNDARVDEVSTDEWLVRIYGQEREPVDGPAAIDKLDVITLKKGSRPTIGWMQRNTRPTV